MKRFAGIFVVCFALSLGSPFAKAEDLDFERGFTNYRAIINGQKKLSDLSPIEQREVLAIYRAVQSRDSSDDSEECRDAKDEAENTASQLADYSRKLMRCAESEDFSDDCSSEFRRVKSAQYDYESAVSTVSSECD